MLASRTIFSFEKGITHDGFQEKIDDSMEQIRCGEYVEMLPGEILDDMLLKIGRDI